MRDHLPLLADADIGFTEVCLYTVAPGDQFQVDFLPGRSDVIVASPCSGHGFEFWCLIGSVLADLALAGRTELAIESCDCVDADPGSAPPFGFRQLSAQPDRGSGPGDGPADGAGCRYGGSLFPLGYRSLAGHWVICNRERARVTVIAGRHRRYELAIRIWVDPGAPVRPVNTDVGASTKPVLGAVPTTASVTTRSTGAFGAARGLARKRILTSACHTKTYSRQIATFITRSVVQNRRS